MNTRTKKASVGREAAGDEVKRVFVDAPDVIPLGADAALRALHTEVARLFDFFNARHWRGELPSVVFAWFPQPTNGKRFGHYGPARWTAGQLSNAEIVFSADLCLSAGAAQVAQTLLHEMVHHWQETCGKPARPPHHNKAWHREAARVGLETEGPKGHTIATAAFAAQLAEFGLRDEVLPFRSDVRKRVAGKMRKWECPCGVIVRVGRSEFRATCGDCGGSFERQV